MDKREDAARQAGGEKGPEVERTVLDDAAGEIDAGIFFGGCEFDVGISFVVPKHDVELRVVLLDEIILEGESFAFVGDDDGFEVGNFANERAGFCVGPAGFEDVGADATAERVGFSDVDDVASGVFEEIDAGFFGQLRGLFFGVHQLVDSGFRVAVWGRAGKFFGASRHREGRRKAFLFAHVAERRGLA